METDFPRGNRKVESREPNLKRKQDQLLPFEPHKKSQKKRKVDNAEIKIDISQKPIDIQKGFTYNSIREGMIVLGCIKNISNLTLQIEFPNLVFAQVKLNCISEALTNFVTTNLSADSSDDLHSVLKKIFKVGQCVPSKILKIENTSKGFKIDASINPNDINANILHYSFKKGTTIWANITTELDHGYELSTGVKNCRVFLPHKNIDNLKKYEIGEPLFCVVHKCEQLNNVTTLTVSAKIEHLNKSQLTEMDNLNILVPGTRIELLVEELMMNGGIKGSFLNNFNGYIDKIHQFNKCNKVKEATTILAYVLYTEPISAITYLTLKDIYNLPDIKYISGKILSGTISLVSSRGLFLNLGSNEIGFVTNNRLLNTLSKSNLNKFDLKDMIHKKYPVGSKHMCRILDYNQMENFYICTVEPNVVKEKIYNLQDLKLGEKVTVNIQKKVANGIIVTIGNVQGFVPNMHISNISYTDSVKEKYAERMKVPARVLNISEDGNVIFTLKQEMVESENCLLHLDDAVPNTKYVGYIIKTKISGTLVGFYGNIKGWISNRRLNAELKCYNDPREYFFRGQVVTVWSLGMKNDMLQLSLNPLDSSKIKSLKLGSKYNGTITTKNQNELNVIIKTNQVEGTIPYSYLSRDSTLGKMLLETYKSGVTIPNLICIKGGIFPILSKRENTALGNRKYKLLKLADVKKGMILKASYEGKAENGIRVSLLLEDFGEQIEIPNTQVYATKTDRVNFSLNDFILTKVLNIEGKTISLTVRPDQVHFQNVEYSVDLMVSYLNDLDDLKKSKINSDLKKYKIGSKIECTIQSITKNGCCVLLSDGTKGVVPSFLYNGVPKLNSTVEGVILECDLIEKFLYVSLRNIDKKRIQPIATPFNKPFNTYGMVELLLVTKYYALGLLKDSNCGNRLIYLPVNYTESDNSLITLYNRPKFKVLLLKEYKKKIIGVPKKLAKPIIKQKSIKRKENGTVDTEQLPVKRIKSINTNKLPDDLIEEINVEDNNDDEESGNVDDEITDNNDAENTNDGVIEEKCNISESESDEEKSTEINGTDDNLLVPALSSVDIFYKSDEKQIDDILIDNRETQKEKKNIPKKTEEEIAKIEKELADQSLTPHSVEQFERLLLANPNSSELWLRYMAMLVSTTELNKARAVGQQALDTINPTLSAEKLNIWNALLHLENIYGTKEGFDELFERALKYNDSFEIYIKVISMLANSNKFTEMEEKIKKFRAKEKTNIKMWIELGKVYYSINKYKEARNLLEAALKSILDQKTQLQIILKFAILEFQFGELQQALAQFTTILDVHGKKINIWTTYIDQLIKKKEIELARQTLRKAISHKFPVKSMKMLFQKFIALEEQYGNAETVEDVKNQAKNYVNSVMSK